MNPQPSDESEVKPLDADIVCVGYGPATAGFLTTLTRGLQEESGQALESRAMPGLPPQVLCYERADDIAFGVSGVVTRGRAIRASFPELPLEEIPMATRVSDEKLVYLLDPVGASRRPALMQLADKVLQAFGIKNSGWELPYCPAFLHKRDGFILSLGQFNQWTGQQVMMSGLAQIWPSTPVAEALVENDKVTGVVLAGDGTEVRAELTVVGDGPIGPVGRRLDETMGMPEGHARDEWAVGMKMVVELPESCTLPEGTVFHTIGYPEPEIFGFFYVHPGRVASVGIFVPSWLETPARTAYRYLQHFVQHPYLWQHLEGGRMRSWGAKSLLESGRRGEPHLCGDGYARIGEGSGSTNVLTGSGVDEAWLTGTQLAEAVLEIYRAGLPFSKENLKSRYEARRRRSWLEDESIIAEKARNGFQRGVLTGFIGMGLAGLTNGRVFVPRPKEDKQPARLEDFYVGRVSHSQIEKIREHCNRDGKPLHDALMDAAGWPPIEFDGQLLVSHQDALLMGGKVQAPSETPDHVIFLEPDVCIACHDKICIEICSGEAIHPGSGVPAFDHEKCVHCGACLWNCPLDNIEFCAAPGGLHSAEN
ncbi:4Fe-4S binding protein [Paludibaculum fermentans]|uniref:4Fe-4S binding protein n=1 Tax=Paludibaculum fermentans TaxID=1473598 RepID=UPI003EBB6FC6